MNSMCSKALYPTYKMLDRDDVLKYNVQHQDQNDMIVYASPETINFNIHLKI